LCAVSEQPVLAPFERRIGVAENAHQVLILGGGLDADMFQHRLAAMVLQRIAVHGRASTPTGGEGDLGIADGVDLPVDSGDGDAEQVGIGLDEFGDVVGRLAAGYARDALMQLVEVVLNGR
jgi:hypothetical protein